MSKSLPSHIIALAFHLTPSITLPTCHALNTTPIEPLAADHTQGFDYPFVASDAENLPSGDVRASLCSIGSARSLSGFAGVDVVHDEGAEGQGEEVILSCRAEGGRGQVCIKM